MTQHPDSLVLLRNLCTYLINHDPGLASIGVVLGWKDAQANSDHPGFCLQPGPAAADDVAMLRQAQILVDALLQRVQQKTQGQGPADAAQTKAEDPAGPGPGPAAAAPAD